MKNNQPTNNPFEFAPEETVSSSSKKIEFTPVLIGTSNSRATELMRAVANKPELHVLANRVLDDCQASDLIKLIESVFDEATIQEDCKILAGANEDQLSRLLESRRSDRSKAKTKGPRKNVSVAQTLISSMYAEILIRKVWNKPYESAQTDMDINDLDAVNRKIKSLQSKKSRLTKLASYDATAKKELEEVETEIERLASFRPAGNVVTKSIIKSTDVDSIRKALELIDTTGLDAEMLEKISALKTKLG